MAGVAEPAPFPQNLPPLGIHQHGSGITQVRADGTQVVHHRRTVRGCVACPSITRCKAASVKVSAMIERASPRRRFRHSRDLPDLGIRDGQQLGLDSALNGFFLS